MTTGTVAIIKMTMMVMGNGSEYDGYDCHDDDYDDYDDDGNGERWRLL